LAPIPPTIGADSADLGGEVNHDVRIGVPEQVAHDRSLGQVVLGHRGRHYVTGARCLESLEDVGAQKAVATGDQNTA